MARQIPRSYDEIVRRTVPEPDSSFRPDASQKDQTNRLKPSDPRVYARLSEELLDDHSLGHIGFEVDQGRVTLHGTVRDARSISYLENLARSIEGVDDVINRLVVHVTTSR